MPTDSRCGLCTKRQGNVLQVTLSRAEKGNALTLAMIQALTTTFQEAAEDNGVLRIVLAADGKYFCAGVDLGADGGILEADAEAKNRQWLMLQSLPDDDLVEEGVVSRFQKVVVLGQMVLVVLEVVLQVGR